MIEHSYEIPFVARLALKEKQIQQNIRPIIGVHKWFARRPGSLFRALTLAEFLGRPVHQTYYGSHQLAGRRVADPFMGGGTPVLEANRLGCDVVGYDINPMAWWVVSEEIKHIDVPAYRRAADRLIASLRREVGELYTTRCEVTGVREAQVKTFFWVKVCDCEKCARANDLFPGYLLAEDKRHPRNVLICATCGEFTEAEDLGSLPACRSCRAPLVREGRVRRGRFSCVHCAHEQRVPQNASRPLRHRMFGLEYHNPSAGSGHIGRFFKRADAEDIAKATEAERRLSRLTTKFVPDEEIPAGDESTRLHRWGYSRWRELFHPRQLLGLELSARLVSATSDARIRTALATNLSDLLRYQNSLCRYDTMALKVLDIFSVHGFPVGFVSAEANLLGILGENGAPVGSGGWENIAAKYAKAKVFCDEPFEVRYDGRRKSLVPSTEWIGAERNGTRPLERREIGLHCGDATRAKFAPGSLDAVFTDPPYVGNVQYSELMDFCYVWLRRLVAEDAPHFAQPSTRRSGEVVGNETAGRDLTDFAERLGRVWQTSARALKPGAPLAFTFHHNDPDAYAAVATAILDAGLVCSASLPCPAEMGGSVHIHHSNSSILDTVFVCRATGRTKARWLCADLPALLALVSDELALLTDAGVKPTLGDARCLTLGHLSRLAVWSLRHSWKMDAAIERRLESVRAWIASFGPWEARLRELDLATTRGDRDLPLFVRESLTDDDSYAAF